MTVYILKNEAIRGIRMGLSRGIRMGLSRGIRMGLNRGPRSEDDG